METHLVELKRAKLQEFSSFIAACATLFFFCSFTLLAGIGTLDSIKISSILTIQVTAGGLIWASLRKTNSVAFLEHFGMGLAFGSFLTVVVSQILKSTPYSQISYFVPLVLVAGQQFRLRNRLTQRSQNRVDLPRLDEVTVLFGFGLIVLSYWWFWTWLLVPIPLLLGLGAYAGKKFPRLRKVFLQHNSLKILLIVFFVGLATILILATKALQSLNTIWWIFSHDQTYLEGISTSITTWPNKENIHAVGTGFTYHWFTLAWSGDLSKSAHLAPFISLTKVLPICGLLGSVSFIWTITKSLTNSKYAPLASLLLFSIGWNIFNMQPVRFTNSPTFLFSLLWFFSFVYVFHLGTQIATRHTEFTLGVLIAANFGGKVTNGVVLFGATCIALLTSLCSVNLAKHRKFLLKTTLYCLIGSVITYFYVYRLQSNSQDNTALHLSPGQVSADLGIMYYDSSTFIQVLGLSTVALGFAPIFALTKPFVFGRSGQFLPVAHLFAGISMTGFFLMGMLGHSGASQLYFFLTPIAFASVFAGVSLAENLNFQFTNRIRGKMIIGMVLGVLTAIAHREYFNWVPSQFNPYHASVLIKTFFVAVIFIFAFIFQYFPMSSRELQNNRQSIRTIRLIMVSAFVITLGTTQLYGQFANSLATRTDIKDPNLIQGSVLQNEALTWLRENSRINDVVATNRFCIPNVDPCNPKWYLVSAVSRRRMLIEGFANSPDLISKQKHSQGFADNANYLDYTFLIGHKVKWIVVDNIAIQSDGHSWAPFANIAFKNDDMTILQLN
jgi:hypothetical protein